MMIQRLRVRGPNPIRSRWSESRRRRGTGLIRLTLTRPRVNQRPKLSTKDTWYPCQPHCWSIAHRKDPPSLPPNQHTNQRLKLSTKDTPVSLSILPSEKVPLKSIFSCQTQMECNAHSNSGGNVHSINQYVIIYSRVFHENTFSKK